MQWMDGMYGVQGFGNSARGALQYHTPHCRVLSHASTLIPCALSSALYFSFLAVASSSTHVHDVS